jgi:hypothetical protein
MAVDSNGNVQQLCIPGKAEVDAGSSELPTPLWGSASAATMPASTAKPSRLRASRPRPRLAHRRQAKALGVSRGAVYCKPRPVSAADLKIVRRPDELRLDHPFAGARMLRESETHRVFADAIAPRRCRYLVRRGQSQRFQMHISVASVGNGGDYAINLSARSGEIGVEPAALLVDACDSFLVVGRQFWRRTGAGNRPIVFSAVGVDDDALDLGARN